MKKIAPFSQSPSLIVGTVKPGHKDKSIYKDIKQGLNIPLVNREFVTLCIKHNTMDILLNDPTKTLTKLQTYQQNYAPH